MVPEMPPNLTQGQHCPGAAAPTQWGGMAKSGSASCPCSCFGSAQETGGDIYVCQRKIKKKKKKENRKVAALK